MPVFTNLSQTKFYPFSWEEFCIYVEAVCVQYPQELSVAQTNEENQILLVHYLPIPDPKSRKLNRTILIFIKNQNHNNDKISVNFTATYEGHILESTVEKGNVSKYLNVLIILVTKEATPQINHIKEKEAESAKQIAPKPIQYNSPIYTSSAIQKQPDYSGGIIFLIIIIVILIVLIGSSGSWNSGDDSDKNVHVRGYTKKNGTYVAPYQRSSPHHH